MLDLLRSQMQALQEAGAPYCLTMQTSFSQAEELNSSTSRDTPLLAVSYGLVIAFSFLITRSYTDLVLSKGMVVGGAVLGIALAIASSWGLMGYCGVPFNPVVTFSSFLLLGLGFDDAFVIVQAYHTSAPALSSDATVRERIGHTLRTAGVSILFTSLTDCVAFVVGSTSSFPAVVAFCQYSAVGVAFLFVYQIVCMGTFLALDTHREYCGVRDFMCLTGKGYLWGSRYDPDTALALALGPKQPIPVMPEALAVGRAASALGRFLCRPLGSALVLGLYVGYLVFVVVGCQHLGTGLDLRDLASTDSYWSSFLEQRFKHFTSVEGPVWAVITPKDSIDFADPDERVQYTRLLGDLEVLQPLSNRRQLLLQPLLYPPFRLPPPRVPLCQQPSALPMVLQWSSLALFCRICHRGWSLSLWHTNTYR